MRSIAVVTGAMFQAIRDEITQTGKVPYSVNVILDASGLHLILKHDVGILEPTTLWTVLPNVELDWNSRTTFMDTMKALKTLGNDYIRELNTSVTGHEDTSNEYTD